MTRDHRFPCTAGLLLLPDEHIYTVAHGGLLHQSIHLTRAPPSTDNVFDEVQSISSPRDQRSHRIVRIRASFCFGASTIPEAAARSVSPRHCIHEFKPVPLKHAAFLRCWTLLMLACKT